MADKLAKMRENNKALDDFLNRIVEAGNKDIALVGLCFGCAHSAAIYDFPSFPSGERPCCFCVRNPELEQIQKEHKTERDQKPDSEGTMRDMNPFAGNWYNGSPAVKVPMDCYHSLDYSDQNRFWDEHPEYAKSIRFDGDNMIVVEDEKP